MLKKVLKNIALVFLVSYVFCFLMEYQPKYNIFLLAFSFVFIITSELIDANKKNINNEILSENIGSKEKENEKKKKIKILVVSAFFTFILSYLIFHHYNILK